MLPAKMVPSADYGFERAAEILEALVLDAAGVPGCGSEGQ